LIAQHRPRAESFIKTPESRWLLSTFDGLEAAMSVESLEISIPLAEVFARVEFRPAGGLDTPNPVKRRGGTKPKTNRRRDRAK
jgi:hypothetical protein